MAGRTRSRRRVRIYCVRCRVKVPVEARKMKLSNSRYAWTGVCPLCKTRVFRMARR